MDASSRAARIKLLALDVDGVMTDGSLIYGDHGEEYKAFCVQDGLGIKLAKFAGITTVIITGRTSSIVEARAADLGIEHVYQGVENKRALLGDLLEKLGYGWPAVAFMGDDIIDLPAMMRCGMAIAPANARPQIKEKAHLVTESGGGHSAVRDAIEFILAAQGKLDGAFAVYLDAQ
ncbi:MAG: KdsC family phosphatase [Betaproteobacteria bacterium]